MDSLSARGDRSVELILDAAKRGAWLADRVTAIAQMELKGLAADSRPLDLTPIVQDACDLLQARAEINEISLSLAIDVPGICVYGNERLLFQVVSNLIDNAIKYGGTYVRVRLGMSKERPEAVISVSDDGIGIAEGEKDTIFDEFARSDSPEARNRSGSGLGLTLVREVVEQHDGHVTVSSRLGRGSEFVVTLPVL